MQKKYLSSFIFFIISLNVYLYSENYRIKSVEYEIEGRTQEYALKKAVPIDTETIFPSEDIFKIYIKNLEQQFINERVLESSTIGYEKKELVDDTRLIHLTIKVKDTWNIIIFPYPKYDSNTGFSVKIKAKDYNFLGTMNELEAEIVYFSKPPLFLDKNKNPIPLSAKTGNGISASVSFGYPFKAGLLDSEWKNDIQFAWIFGENAPYATTTSGISFSVPLGLVSIDFGVQEAYTCNTFYETSHDSNYTTSSFHLGLPIRVYTDDFFGKIKITPFAQCKFNADADIFTNPASVMGINDTDLHNPTVEEGLRVTTGNINWFGNFRSGFQVEISGQYLHKLTDKEHNFEIQLNTQGFLSLEKMGIAARASSFYHFEKKDTRPAGYYMRGIPDTQASASRAAILNIDMPITVFTTDWRKIGLPTFSRYADFELQISPFIDVAITDTEIDKTIDNEKTPLNSSDILVNDYAKLLFCTGAEILVYPTKMRSIQGRVSIGFYIGKMTLQTELFLGLGLFY